MEVETNNEEIKADKKTKYPGIKKERLKKQQSIDSNSIEDENKKEENTMDLKMKTERKEKKVKKIEKQIIEPLKKDEDDDVFQEQIQPPIQKKQKIEREKKEKKQILYEAETNPTVEPISLPEHQKEADVKDILERCLEIFPHLTPYDSQVESMKSIIECLNSRENLLFQSPTGTGKTLVALCSALAYIEKNKDTQILVLTRTNEQINGFIKEIRKISNYNNINQYSILAGRGQLCLHLEEAKKEFKSKNNSKLKFNDHLQSYCNGKQEKKKQQNTKMNDEESSNLIKDQNNKMKDKDNSNNKVQQKKINDDEEEESNSIQDQMQCVHSNIQPPNQKILSKESEPIRIISKSFGVQEEDQQNQSCNCCKHYLIYQKFISQNLDKSNRDENIEPSQPSKKPKDINIYYPYIVREDQPSLPDLEDIKDLFKQEKLGCPFYINKLAAKSAKIIYTTYNYIIKQKILDSISGLFKGKLIVIFDEAHNISDQAEKEQQINLRQKHYQQVKTTLQTMQEIFSSYKQNNYQNLLTKYSQLIEGAKDDIEVKVQEDLKEFEQKIINQNIAEMEGENIQINEEGVKQFIQEDSTQQFIQKIAKQLQNKYVLKYIESLIEQEQLNKILVKKKIYELIKEDLKDEKNYQIDLLKKIIFKQSNKALLNNSSSGYDDEDGGDEEEEDEYVREDEKIIITHAKYSKYEEQNQKQNKFRYKNKNQLGSDLYDKINDQIRQEKGNQIHSSSDSIQKVTKYIDDVKKSNDNLDEKQNNNIFQLYYEERKKEVFQFLNNITSIYQCFTEDCDFLQTQFDTKNRDIQYFLNIFSEKEQIEKNFEDLNITDTESAQQFLDKMKHSQIMITYIEKVISNFIKKQKKNKSGIQGGDIYVKEQGYLYQSIKVSLSTIEDVAKKIQTKYFEKFWNFFHRLLKYRKLYIQDQFSDELQNHYLSFQKGDENKEAQPFYQIGSLSAKYIFQDIKRKLNIQSIILASGTLQPFDLIENSIALPFRQLVAPHVIDPKTNLFTQFISSYNNQPICFSYSQLKNQKQKESIYNSSHSVVYKILDIFTAFTLKTKKKSGAIIFFKNYNMLNEFQKENKIKCKIAIYYESRESNIFQKDYQEYKENILKNRQNCLFLAVSKGKLSEGIDLKDELCRIVILYGVPYLYNKDPYIQCKKKHAKQVYNDNLWYDKETVKTVNQAAGRCIRYKEDWGCIFFLDQLYKMKDNIYQNISKWIIEGQKFKAQGPTDQQWLDSYQLFLNDKCYQQQRNDQVFQ